MSNIYWSVKLPDNYLGKDFNYNEWETANKDDINRQKMVR